MLGQLSAIGRDPASGGVSRFAWTPVDLELREWFASEAATRGMDLVVDRCGNQWAWLGDPDRDGPGVVVGSHLDSVPGGGEYDGPLGVVSAFAVVDRLIASGDRPAKPVAVVNFSDEEGARFGVACMGSRLLTGQLTPERALALVDNDGTTMASALEAAGRSTGELGRDTETLRWVGSFVELHIEQGRLLSALPDQDAPVAVGDRIWPHGRWRLDLVGEGNHAGTTRLIDRDDPMLLLAAAISTARSAAERVGIVATIGKLQVNPNAVNAIPSSITAWLDARGGDVGSVRAAVAEIGASVGIEPVEESFTAATSFDDDLVTRLVAALDGPPVIPTGAGHDAGILALAGVPTAMLFVRNPTGISHSPEEWAEPADCAAGVDALHCVVDSLLSS